MNIDEFERRFQAAYKSAYPIICVETFEEEWALQFFADFIQRGKDHEPGVTRVLQDYRSWSRVFGFNKKFKIEPDRDGKNLVEIDLQRSRSPIQALEYIYDYISSKTSPAMLFILRDLNEDLEKNDVVQRFIREIFFKAETTKHCVVLLQPDFNIPTTLEKELMLLDFATPTIGERKEFFDEYIAQPNITNNLDEEQEQKYYATLPGLTRFESNHLLMEMAYEKNGVIDESLLEYAKAKKKENIRKGKLLEYIDTDITIKDIGGLDLLKKFLDKEADAATPQARAFGIKPPKGIILFGPPGTGKTQIAKATANALNMPLIAWNIGKMFGGLVGQSEATTRQTIKQLEQNAPAVVLLDEIDKYLGGLKGSSGDSGVGSRVLGTILSFMSDTTAPLFFVATSNSIDLPPEILRKGRWDEMFYVPLPGYKARKSIFRIHLSKVGREPENFNLKLLAKKSKNYTGAEIEQAIQEALKHAFHEGEEDINDVHILNAIEETKCLAITMKNSLAALQTFAEHNARNASSEEQERFVEDVEESDEESSPFKKKRTYER